MGEAKRRRAIEAVLGNKYPANGLLPKTHYDLFWERYGSVAKPYIEADKARLGLDLEGAGLGDALGDILKSKDFRFLNHLAERFPSVYTKPHLRSDLAYQYISVLGFEIGGKACYRLSDQTARQIDSAKMIGVWADFMMPVSVPMLDLSCEQGRYALGRLVGEELPSDTQISVYCYERSTGGDVRCIEFVVHSSMDSDEKRFLSTICTLLPDGSTIESGLEGAHLMLEHDQTSKDAMVVAIRPLLRLILGSLVLVGSKKANLVQASDGFYKHSVNTGAEGLTADARTFTSVDFATEDVDTRDRVVVLELSSSDSNHSGSGHSGRHLKVQFTVPTFWRRRPGSSPDSEKNVRVKQHRRGPKDACVVGRQYLVV